MDGLVLPPNETGSMCWLTSLMAALAGPGDARVTALFEGTPVGDVLHAMSTAATTVSATSLLTGQWALGQHDAGEFFMISCPRYGFSTVRDVVRTYTSGAPEERESFPENQKVESLAHYGQSEIKLSTVFPREEVTVTEACTVRTVTKFVAGEVVVFTTDQHSSKRVEFEPEVTLGNVVYHLASVIVWRGAAGGSAGHYTAFVKRGGKWHFCDDGRVYAVGDDTPETWRAATHPMYSYAPGGFKPQCRNNVTGEVLTLESREELDAHKAAHGSEKTDVGLWAPSRHGTFFMYLATSN